MASTDTPQGAQTYDPVSGTFKTFTPAAPAPQPTGGALPGANPANAGQPGFDTFGNAVPGTPLATGGSDVTAPGTPGAPAPINRTIVDPATDPATAYLNNFQPPQTADQIAEQKRTDAQSQIDSLNKVYDDRVAAEKLAGQDRTNKNNAVSVLSGLSGSTEAVRTDNEVSAANQKNVAAINDQRNNALQTIYSKISDDAQTEAEQQKQDAQKSAEDIIARRTQVTQQAQDNLKLIAAGGQTFDNFKATATPDAYQHALDAFGGSENALRGFMALNKPQSTIVSSGVAPDGHTFYSVSKDPLTGQISTEHFDLGFTVDNSATPVTLANGDLMFVPKNGIDLSKPLDSQVQVYKGGSDPLKQLQMQSLQLDIQKKQNDLNGGGAGSTVPIADSTGKTVNVPIDVAPYYNTSHSGVAYADLSTVQGTAAEKKAVVDAAQAAGIKVITNKNTALDLTNIQDANSKLDSISTIMAGIDQPDVLSRALAPISTTLASMAQTNPQRAAAGALQGVGLDILKAISGVQGFRGNSAVVQQITDHLPSIYDTNAVVQQKVAYIRTLISDREDAIVGKPSSAPAGAHPSQIEYQGKTYNVDANGDMTPA